ncbi:MAG: alpha/beta hydrolase fold domain-containing protein [Candidatus Nanopelagicales bacterium]
MPRSGRAVLGAAAAAVVAAGGVVAGKPAARSLRRRRSAMAAVAPELRSPLLYLPIHLTSTRFVSMTRKLPVPPALLTGGGQVEQVVVPGAPGDPDVVVYVYRPTHRLKLSGALLWIHGRGDVIGHPAAYQALCRRLAADAGVLVASVDYQLAPEHPFPAGLSDCYAALGWLHAHAGELGVDADHGPPRARRSRHGRGWGARRRIRGRDYARDRWDSAPRPLRWRTAARLPVMLPPVGAWLLTGTALELHDRTWAFTFWAAVVVACVGAAAVARRIGILAQRAGDQPAGADTTALGWALTRTAPQWYRLRWVAQG